MNNGFFSRLGAHVMRLTRVTGVVATINSQSPIVLERDASNYVYRCRGAFAPTDGGAGYAKGCTHVKTDGGVATTLYINEGTSSSCDFNAVESSASTVTAVVAGAGLTGGGTEGSVTLTVGAGTGVTVNADDVAIDETYLRIANVVLTNAEMLALRATPKELVAAPGAGKVLSFVSATLLFDYVGAYTESADNLAIKFENGSGVAVSDTIEATGFVDATADTITFARKAVDGIVAKTGAENKALVLHNIGDGEFGGGNAGNAIRVKIAYRVHPTGF